jgi:hypothetical protein
MYSTAINYYINACYTTCTVQYYMYSIIQYYRAVQVQYSTAITYYINAYYIYTVQYYMYSIIQYYRAVQVQYSKAPSLI